MKKLTIAAALCLVGAVSGAFAAKFSINGRLVQSLTASDNLFLSQHPAGLGYESVSSLFLNFLAKTHLTKYALNTNVSYSSYGGPGAADTTLKTALPAGVNFTVDHSVDPLTQLNFNTSWHRADVASALLAQTGQATGNGYSDTYSLQGQLTRQVSPIDSLSFSGSASRTDFTVPGQTPYKDLTGTASWRRHLTHRVTLTTMASGDWYSADDVSGTERLLWTLSAALEVQLSPLLTANARFAELFVNYWSSNGGAPLIVTGVPAFQGGGGAAHAPTWDIGLTYRMTPTTVVSAQVAKAITPTILGGLQQSTSYGANLNHAVNHHISVYLSGRYSQLTAVDGDSDLLSLSTGLTYLPARHYSMTLSYTFSRRTDAAGAANGNTVLYTFARDLTILP